MTIVEGGSEIVGEFASLTDQVFITDDDPRKPTSASVEKWLADAHPQRRRSSLRLFHAPGRARVAAILNPRLTDERGAPIGLLGFFEAEDDQDAVTAVLDAGATWLRERGATIVRGPVNFSTWNDYRFATSAGEGWIRGEPYHPLRYLPMWERAGFATCATYGTYWLDPVAQMLAHFAPGVERAAQTRIHVRAITAGDLPALHQLALAGFERAFSYSPIEPDEFLSLYTADAAAQASAMSFIAVQDGRPLGFIYAFIAELPRGPAGVIKTIVVRPEARGGAVYATLVSAAYRAFEASGLTRTMAALMHVDGSPAQMGWCRPENLFKQYVLLEQRT